MTTESVSMLDLSQTGGDNGDRGIEEEVLGPIRVWHLVFIIAVLLLTVVIVICCCFDFRIPRTRQEIEDNFQKRTLNKQYLRILERNPEELLKKQGDKSRARGGVAVTDASKRLPQTRGQVTASTPRLKPKTTGQNREQSKLTQSSRAGIYEDDAESDSGKRDSEDYSPVARPRPKFGQQAPLALNPRDILALMSQGTRKGNG